MHIVPAVVQCTCNDACDKDEVSLIVSAKSLLDTASSYEQIHKVNTKKSFNNYMLPMHFD